MKGRSFGQAKMAASGFSSRTNLAPLKYDRCGQENCIRLSGPVVQERIAGVVSNH